MHITGLGHCIVVDVHRHTNFVSIAVKNPEGLLYRTIVPKRHLWQYFQAGSIVKDQIILLYKELNDKWIEDGSSKCYVCFLSIVICFLWNAEFWLECKECLYACFKTSFCSYLVVMIVYLPSCHGNQSSVCCETQYIIEVRGDSLWSFFLLSDGTDIVTGTPKRHRLHPNVTEVGSERPINTAESQQHGHQSQSLQLFGPNVQPRHCVIAHTEGIVTVTPCSGNAETYVNGQRIYETTILQVP
jgi:hypothetical protein